MTGWYWLRAELSGWPPLRAVSPMRPRKDVRADREARPTASARLPGVRRAETRISTRLCRRDTPPPATRRWRIPADREAPGLDTSSRDQRASPEGRGRRV